MASTAHTPKKKNIIVRFFTMNTSGEAGGRDLPLWKQLLLQLLTLFIAAQVMFPIMYIITLSLSSKSQRPTSLELFPSFAAASGALMRDDIELDGFDWWPVIRGEQPSAREEMFWQRKDQVGARVGHWKWVDMGRSGKGLYDLSSDIAEKNDLSAQRPEVLKMIKSRYADWRTQMDQSDARGPFRDY